MFKKQVEVFMIFDKLGDTVRTGHILWQIDRERLEDVKDHILDLLLITRLIEKYFPTYIDLDKIYDYIICHDLPEAITGDITKFEGVSEEEIKRVTELAIEYLVQNFNDVMDFKTIINNYEARNDIESKIVHMIDKVHSASTFIKYESENHVDMNNPNIIPVLRFHPYVDEKINEGMDLADIFYNFHIRAVNITNDECIKYGISNHDADRIVTIIREFAKELYKQKIEKTIFDVYDDFPKDAMVYNRKI